MCPPLYLETALLRGTLSLSPALSLALTTMRPLLIAHSLALFYLLTSSFNGISDMRDEYDGLSPELEIGKGGLGGYI